MSWITKNAYDEGTRALLRSNVSARRVAVGAGDDQPAFPVGIFAAIIAAGILGGAVSTYYEREAARTGRVYR